MRTKFFQSMTSNATSRIRNTILFFKELKDLKGEAAELVGLCAFGVYIVYHIKKDSAKRPTEKMQVVKSAIESESCENTTEQNQAALKQARKILAQIELASFDCDHTLTRRLQ